MFIHKATDRIIYFEICQNIGLESISVKFFSVIVNFIHTDIFYS